jgi:hypothetical protein
VLTQKDIRFPPTHKAFAAGGKTGLALPDFYSAYDRSRSKPEATAPQRQWPVHVNHRT